MAGSLWLDSLEISRYRGLRELKIEKLGRVNLIVGKNNVGKTSVLEALWLYANPASPNHLIRLAESRHELAPDTHLRLDERDLRPFPFECFFYGREVTPEESRIQIGPIGPEEKKLRIQLTQWRADTPNGPRGGFALAFRLGGAGSSIPVDTIWGLLTQTSQLQRRLPPWAEYDLQMVYVSSDGLDLPSACALWDQIALTSEEGEVISALRLISPEVERLSLKAVDRLAQLRVPFVKIESSDVPIPLRSLGDGLNRLFGIASALVNAKDGILLVDEIENGLHYSVQPDIWRLIFRLASQLNVQVFATTHSYDCIKAFQEAAAENEQEEGVLIRLYQRAGEIRATPFDEEEVGIAVEAGMEIR